MRAARAALPAWAATPPAERAAGSARCATCSRPAEDEIAETVTAELGAPLALSQTVHAGVPVAGRRLATPNWPPTYSFEEKIGNSTVLPRAGRRGRRDHALELPAAPDRRQGRPGARRGLHRRAQARRGHPAGRPALRRGRRTRPACPPGVFNLVTGLGPVAGQALAAHPGVDLVSFTGSTAVGRQIGATAGAAVKRVALELGGKSANVILPSADLAKAVNVGVANVMSNSGQTCSAWTRMLVHRDQYDEAVALAAAAAAKYVPGERHRPASSTPSSSDRVRGYIEKGVAEGARLVAGGPEAPRRDAATTSARPSSPTSPRR